MITLELSISAFDPEIAPGLVFGLTLAPPLATAVACITLGIKERPSAYERAMSPERWKVMVTRASWEPLGTVAVHFGGSAVDLVGQNQVGEEALQQYMAVRQ
jgi:hypothetical protein